MTMAQRSAPIEKRRGALISASWLHLPPILASTTMAQGSTPTGDERLNLEEEGNTSHSLRCKSPERLPRRHLRSVLSSIINLDDRRRSSAPLTVSRRGDRHVLYFMGGACRADARPRYERLRLDHVRRLSGRVKTIGPRELRRDLDRRARRLLSQRHDIRSLMHRPALARPSRPKKNLLYPFRSAPGMVRPGGRS
jgi:hypothetical protein